MLNSITPHAVYRTSNWTLLHLHLVSCTPRDKCYESASSVCCLQSSILQRVEILLFTEYGILSPLFGWNINISRDFASYWNENHHLSDGVCSQIVVRSSLELKSQKVGPSPRALSNLNKIIAHKETSFQEAETYFKYTPGKVWFLERTSLRWWLKTC